MSQPDNHAAKQLEEELILAREVGRGISVPVFAGFTVNLQGHRVNLWWQDRHRKLRCFSDAFVTPNNRLILVVASVTDSLDATGLALSVRAFFRGCFSRDISIQNGLNALEQWIRQDPQWFGCCHLALSVLQQDGELEVVRCGNASLSLQHGDGIAAAVDLPDALPALLGPDIHTDNTARRKLTLVSGDTFRLWTEDEAVSATVRVDGQGVRPIRSACRPSNR